MNQERTEVLSLFLLNISYSFHQITELMYARTSRDPAFATDTSWSTSPLILCHCVQKCKLCTKDEITCMCSKLIKSIKCRKPSSKNNKNTSRWHKLHLHNCVVILSFFIISLVTIVRVVICSEAVQAAGK